LRQICFQPAKKDDKSEVEEYVKQCKSEIEIDDVTADKLKHGDFSADGEKSKCFVRCFFKK
jgi:hypothetical protein